MAPGEYVGESVGTEAFGPLRVTATRHRPGGREPLTYRYAARLRGDDAPGPFSSRSPAPSRCRPLRPTRHRKPAP